MKHLITVVLFILTAAVSIHAQSSILNSYFELKNSLINSDPVGASVKATGFSEAANSIEEAPLKNKLLADAKLIAESKDISRQREYFSGLSTDFYSLIKTEKVSGPTVYKMYCPMKKMIWFSNEKEIKNPYYGRAMLACGSVTEIINP